MNETLEALYKLADNEKGPDDWLFDEASADFYTAGCIYAEQQRRELIGRLDKHAQTLLDGYVGSLEVKMEYERRLLFRKGLSMGLKLAALGW